MRRLNMGTISNAESGKVYVKGKAAGEYTCDKVTIKITFYCSGVSAAKASESVLQQCEKFLKALEEAGMDIAPIRLHDDSVERSSYRDEERVKATRTLNFDSNAHADINHFILKVIQDEHIDADISTDYYLSNEDAIRKQLRAQALTDSRENAELLAKAAGKSIVGIDTIDMNHHHIRTSLAKSVAVLNSIDCIDGIFSSKLSMPTKVVEEEVEAAWLIG